MININNNLDMPEDLIINVSVLSDEEKNKIDISKIKKEIELLTKTFSNNKDVVSHESTDFKLKQNKEIARRGGNIAKITRNNLEKELDTVVVTANNKLNYQYIDDKKQIENK